MCTAPSNVRQSLGEHWVSSKTNRYTLLNFWYVDMCWSQRFCMGMWQWSWAAVDCDVFFFFFFLTSYYSTETSSYLDQTFHDNLQASFSSSRSFPCFHVCKNSYGYGSMVPSLIPSRNKWDNCINNWCFLTGMAKVMRNILEVHI